MNLFILISTLFALMLIGVPIGFSMFLAAAAYFIGSGNLFLLELLPAKMFEGLDRLILTAIPFFLLSGEIMNRSGMSDRIVDFAAMLVGRFRGGLAQINILSSLIFSGITGVALGDVAALGKIFIPTMERQGYTRVFAAAVTAASSLVGPIVPPSGIIILYCAIMETSVGAMFSAAIVPGLLMGLCDMLLVYYFARTRNFPANKVEITPQRFAHSFSHALLALMMPAIVLGGILGGVMTPTEAAAIAVLYSLTVGVVVMRSLKMGDLPRVLNNALIDSARIFVLIGCSIVLTWIFAIEQVPAMVSNLFASIGGEPLIVVPAIVLLFLFIGTWLEPGVGLILFAPIVVPAAAEVGVHPVQMGIVLIVVVNIGLCTPPVGNVLFAVAGIGRVNVMSLAREMLPFIAIKVLLALVIGFLPALTLFLPQLFGFIK